MQEDPRESFFELTPDRVLLAVEGAGFAPTGHCFALNALENRVYDVRVEEGDATRHLVAKFYRPGRWSEACIAAPRSMEMPMTRISGHLRFTAKAIPPANPPPDSGTNTVARSGH